MSRLTLSEPINFVLEGIPHVLAEIPNGLWNEPLLKREIDTDLLNPEGRTSGKVDIRLTFPNDFCVITRCRVNRNDNRWNDAEIYVSLSGKPGIVEAHQREFWFKRTETGEFLVKPR